MRSQHPMRVAERPAPAPVPESLAAAVAAQCARTPAAPALSDVDRTLDYAGLDRESARLATRLRALGAGPDRIVAVYLDRSVTLGVVLLAIQRAGACYLPLSREDPPARLRALLADAAPVVVMTDAEGVAVLAGVDAPLVDVGAPPPAHHDTGGLDAARADDLSYVIYTSGSTGAPKGVMIEHGAIVNRLRWMQDTFDIGPGDVVLQKTPYTFDVSVWEFFWPLMAGAELTFAAPGGHRDPGYLTALIRERGVTVTHFVPSMLAEFLRVADRSACAGLRRVLASGEALTPALANRFFATLPDVELHNLYGPTEAAVDVSHWRCAPGAASVPIGRAITGVRLHVLDRELRPVPAGTVGELHITGVALARGYLNRPDLTADRFVHAPGGGERMYRTGDLASVRPDGAIEYHGRADNQVKIAGVRLELGEVEAALLALPGVAGAVATTRVDAAGITRVAGYVLADPADGETIAAWRTALRDTLTPAAVPATLTVVDRIPTTVHGKVDLAALPAPDAPAGGPAADALTELWRRELGTDETDVVAAGAGSLHVLRLLAAVRDEFAVDVDPTDFYAEPTMSALARLVAAGLAEPGPALVRGDRVGALRLNRSQERMWFLQRLEPHSTAMSAPTGLRLRGPATVGQIAECLAALVARHEVLRTSFPERDGVPVAVVHPGTDTPPVVVEAPGLTEAERDEVVTRSIDEAAADPFDLSTGPPLRSRLVRFGEDDHLLVLAAHQVVADGWTWSVLAREFAADWNRVAAGAPPVAPGDGPQIVDHARWQRAAATDPAAVALFDESRAHWRRRLADAPDGIALPADRPRRSALSVPAAVTAVPWPPGFAARLRDFCRSERVTEYTVMLALFGCWLARLAGQEDVVVATPSANRVPVAATDLAGYFVTTVPHRLHVEEDTTFVGLLREAHQSTVDGQRHSRVPVEQMMADLGVGRSAGRLALFQHLLAFQNLPPWRISIEDREVRVVQLPTRHTHYDLKLEVFPEDGFAARVVYAAELFGPTRMATMAGQLAVLADRALADPDEYVEDYLLTSQLDEDV
ncbi:amino acid adenylation domain-containing protein [Actinophytocola sp. NPDC049390]|uniref:amino acid adenylation domain-containing protein n=1 Tax=Actinophytocola sp. NPDC049390 TaxID=3363894 RepID=UPI0037971541